VPSRLQDSQIPSVLKSLIEKECEHPKRDDYGREANSSYKSRRDETQNKNLYEEGCEIRLGEPTGRK